ncbi:hypothetical protein Ae201684_014098 [Aphanomyces euteiches]|uniref:Amine oxidase domain-containing protein n=1 Tax=Aphanomyces euteiches TaxID=100861 RepID=A0A6G0WL17_9STRA|nr:hypothetical protein Ae201684_014098 [Aphanomyces euteiches]
MVSLRIWLCVAILQGLALISTTTALGQDSFEAAATSESSQPILPSQPLPISIKRNASIAIIGAGPAGIHHALLLAQKGFSNIVVYEYSNEIGGKSKTIVDETGLPHEMGTCYAHTLYDPIFQLLNTYDPNNVLVPTDPTVPNNTWIMQGNQILFDYPTYLFQQAQTLTGITTLLGIRNATQAAFVKYISIHESIFGKYSYGLPPQPNNWTLLAGTALNFIQTNNLQAIQPWFQTMFERQGYGSLSTTPAFYMLWWGHPDLIRRYLALASQNKPFVYLLSKGFQSLWKSIAAANSAKFTVKLRSVVTGISNRDTKPQVTVRQYAPNANPQSGGATITIPHDHIVMAIDLSISSTDLSTDKGFPISYKSSAFVTTKFTSPAIPSESVIEWWPERGQGNLQGRLQLTRNTRLILTNSSTVSGRQTRVAYQHYEPDTAVAARSSYSSSLVQDLKSTFPSSTNLATFFSSYAPRTTKDKLTQNQPWAIWNYQG